MDIISVLRQAQTPAYVPPVTPRQLGIKLFEDGCPVDACLTPDMRRGWIWAHRMSSYANAAEYMVSQGEAVTI